MILTNMTFGDLISLNGFQINNLKEAKMTEILESKNQEWGFFGTTKLDYSEDETNKRWHQAFITLVNLSNLPSDIIRRYLDSREGRYLATACYRNDVSAKIKDKWEKGSIPKEIFLKDYKKSDDEFYY